jgi:hypothetical protein
MTPKLRSSAFETAAEHFWLRFINDGALKDCDDLEKLVAGCELIATLDDLDLLAA